MDSGRRRLLIGFLIALVSIKFVVLPWLTIQSDQRERLDVLTKRLDRAIGVIANRGSITSSLADLERANSDDRQRFPQAPGLEGFRLQEQQRVVGLLESKGLKLEAFDWILDSPPDGTGLGFCRGRLSLRGELRMLALLLGEVEGRLPNMVVKEVSFNLERPARGALDTNAVVTLVADYHFRIKK